MSELKQHIAQIRLTTEDTKSFEVILAQDVRLMNLLIEQVLKGEQPCPACRRWLRRHACWKTSGGEPCMKPEGHEGGHFSHQVGLAFTDLELDSPTAKWVGDGLCHFRSYESPVHTKCPLPLNHPEPHQAAPRGHTVDCELADWKRRNP